MTQRPNILLVHCHDLGQYLHCYGVETVQTPNLDAFAASGVRFANSFCVAPGCSPSRASIFTGRYPHANGVMGLCHASFTWDLHPEEKHLAQILAENGYSTAAVGVIHETSSAPERCGYQSYDPPARAIEAVDAAILDLESFTRLENNPGHPPGPFFLSVGFIEPHRLPDPGSQPPGEHGFLSPSIEPDDSLGLQVPGYLLDTPGTRQELAELQGAVRHVDTQFGRLMSALDSLELSANTLVIFTTDHGVAMPRAKCSLYDPGIQVAFILRLPSRPGWQGGIVRRELLTNVDYVPTLLDLLGIDPPTNLHGRSFTPLLDGEPYQPRDEVFAEMTYHDYYDPRRCIRTPTHKLIANFSSAAAFMDPSQSWRPRSDTVIPANRATSYHPDIELYDLEADPWEQHDLSDDPAYGQVRSDLASRLWEFMLATGDPLCQGAVSSPQHQRVVTALQEVS